MRTILLIEDEEDAGRPLSAIVGLRGWRVVWAKTLREGFEQLAIAKPDRIILDLMLPDGDGGELLRHIRRFKIETRVLVVTGEYTTRQDVRDLRPDAFLLKPIYVEDILDWLGP